MAPRDVILLLVIVVNNVNSQDFMSLLSPFLGSGLGGGGGNAGGGIQGILAGLGNNNAGPGANLPFSQLFQLGSSLLNKPAAPPPAPRPAAGKRRPLTPPPPTAPVPDVSDYDEPIAAIIPSRLSPQQRRRRQQVAARRRQQRMNKTKQQQQQQLSQKQQRARQLQRQKRPVVPQRRRPTSKKPARRANTRKKTPAMASRPTGPPPPTKFVNPDYDDDIDLSLTGARHLQAHRAADVPNYEASVPIGHGRRQQIDKRYYRPHTRTFVGNRPTGPPIKATAVKPVPQWDLAAVNKPATLFPPFTFATSAPFTFAPPTPFTFPPPVTIAAGPTLPPNPPFKGDPKLFAHNTASMIREIASFSDVHQGQSDYSAVQTLMEAFFESMANGGKVSAASDAPQALQPVYDGTELGANRPLTNKLFESDMVLTVEQMKGVVLASSQQRGGLHRSKRKVITGADYRWHKGPIPYRFKDNDVKWQNSIRSALKEWQKLTCLRWSENGKGKDYVIFFHGRGCYSSVGRTGGSQMISIGYGCEDKGIIMHEVGHSLGFWHEQSRPDRDRYITLADAWIMKGTNGNFERRTEQEIEDMGLPYDLGSVMHYGPNAFTKDWGQLTIKTKDKKYQRTIGQRKNPSFIDVKQVNRLYCNDVCPKIGGPNCQNGGYPDPNNCSKCVCPEGLGGRTCESVAESEEVCGGELTATPFWQELGHRGKKRCYWKIKTDNARIKVILSNVTYRCETTCKAFVEIKHNSDFQQTGFRSCCEGEVQVTSDQSEVIVFTESSIVDYETGFNIRYIKDSGLPLPKPPAPIWVPGQENRGFRGSTASGGPVEKFILNFIPKIRDANKPLESIASIFTEYSVASLLGIRN